MLLVLALALAAIGRPDESSGAGKTEQEPRKPDDPAVYVARTLSVSAAGRDAFVACLRQKKLPVWQQMKRNGLLADHSVFETVSVRLAAPDVPAWNFLLLSHLEPSATPETFFKAEENREGERPIGTRCEDAPGIETRRVEVLRSTPNSYYPRPAPGTRLPGAATEFTVPFIVEYIAVRDTPEALNEYRETMRTNNGPALAQLIRDDMLLNFIALETVSVRYAQPGMPEWNQMHLRGYFPDKGPVPPDAMDAALRRINPKSGGAAGIFGRLAAIRTKPREDVARQLPELAVR
ncbi:MAG TPA: hypothetical protein VFK57_17570 [Vicinamibacterales bacterium]|nr:hypothetical protein [Vicinamibacterales bacterium]